MLQGKWKAHLQLQGQLHVVAMQLRRVVAELGAAHNDPHHLRLHLQLCGNLCTIRNPVAKKSECCKCLECSTALLKCQRPPL